MKKSINITEKDEDIVNYFAKLLKVKSSKLKSVFFIGKENHNKDVLKVEFTNGKFKMIYNWVDAFEKFLLSKSKFKQQPFVYDGVEY